MVDNVIIFFFNTYPLDAHSSFEYNQLPFEQLGSELLDYKIKT